MGEGEGGEGFGVGEGGVMDLDSGLALACSVSGCIYLGHRFGTGLGWYIKRLEPSGT